MYNILIIGAGNLGSRHLQGTLKSKNILKLTVFDPNQNSILLAKNRSTEVEHTHQITFTSNFTDLKSEYFLAIVATNSDVRERVLNDLLAITKISYLILEKVLFQNVSAYQNISNILKSNNITTWVNHPRRMSKAYKWLKNEIQFENSCSITVYGNNWGLACNSIHFLDLISFLFESKVSIINTDLLLDEIIKSKRDGFVEFIGSIHGKLYNNSNFQITCNNIDFQSDMIITISTPRSNYFIQECYNGKILKYIGADLVHTEPLDVKLQSDLTTECVNQIIEHGTTSLTSFEDSKYLHMKYISAFLKKYNQILNLDCQNLPIT